MKAHAQEKGWGGRWERKSNPKLPGVQGGPQRASVLHGVFRSLEQTRPPCHGRVRPGPGRLVEGLFSPPTSHHS